MIIELEEKWLSQIVDFLRQSFENKHIPSHDHTYHQRVWENAKDIMTALEHDAGQTLTPNAVECVFWATLFHDVGLTQNLDEHTRKYKRSDFSRVCDEE